MAYIYMPLFFSILSYGVVYLMTSDLLGVATSAASLFMSSSEPIFSDEYDDIFQPGSVTVSENNTVNRSDIPLPAIGDLYGRVRCSSIGLDVPIYWGNSNTILKRGGGQSTGSYLPGYGGFVFITGHNNTYFNCLQYSKEGDLVEVETSYGLYTYKVFKIETVDVTDKTIYDFAPTDDLEDLILCTCYPFNMLSHTNQRYLVYADLVSGPTVIY